MRLRLHFLDVFAGWTWFYNKLTRLFSTSVSTMLAYSCTRMNILTVLRPECPQELLHPIFIHSLDIMNDSSVNWVTMGVEFSFATQHSWVNDYAKGGALYYTRILGCLEQ